MKLTLTRFETKEKGTTGKLYLPVENPFTLMTLELPWKNNEGFASCIPAGVYSCEEFFSEKFGRTFKILGVPGREDCEFHVGNRLKNTHGCILLGMYHFTQDGEDCVGDSGVAVNKFRYALPMKSFELEIK